MGGWLDGWLDGCICGQDGREKDRAKHTGHKSSFVERLQMALLLLLPLHLGCVASPPSLQQKEPMDSLLEPRLGSIRSGQQNTAGVLVGLSRASSPEASLHSSTTTSPVGSCRHRKAAAQASLPGARENVEEGRALPASVSLGDFTPRPNSFNTSHVGARGNSSPGVA